MNKAFKENQNSKNSEKENPKLKNSSKFEVIIEYIFMKFSSALRIIGPLFAFCLVLFVIIVARTVFYLIIPYWNKNFHKIFGWVFFFIAIYLLFSILFNYFLAVLVKPGCVEDIRRSKFYRKNDPLKYSNVQINFEGCKLAENIKKFSHDEKNDNSALAVKLRFKTEDNYQRNFEANEDMGILENGVKENFNECRKKIYFLFLFFNFILFLREI